MAAISIDLNILYSCEGYTALSDSNQAKFLTLYHYTKTHSATSAITEKGHPLTEWDIAKILRCDIRTVYGFLKQCTLVTKREDAYHVLDPFRTAEVKAIRAALSAYLSDQNIGVILSKTNASLEYIQAKIQGYTESGHTNTKQLFSMILHNY